jgi:outer membrane protein OmpA-like peptidoglycan-associated protein
MPAPITLAILLGAATAVAGAQPPDAPYTWVQVQGASVHHTSQAELTNSRALGLAMGQWLERRWGWEASVLRDTLEDKAGLWSSKVVHVHGSALFNPLPDLGRWRPFLRGGVGVSGGVYEPPSNGKALQAGVGLTGLQASGTDTATSTTRLSLVAGAGLQAAFGEHGMASLEARALGVQVTPAQRRYESQALLGVGYRWGGARARTPVDLPAPPPPIAPAPPAPIAPAPPAPLVHPHPVKPVPPPPLPPPPEPPIQEEPYLDPVPASPEPPEQAPSRRASAPPRRIVLDESSLRLTNEGLDLSAKGERAVRDFAALLIVFPGDYTLVITGHTSNEGPRARNLALSRTWAKALAKAFVRAGVPARKITARGDGPDHPAASNKTAAGRRRNRRVEIQVVAAAFSLQMGPGTRSPKAGARESKPDKRQAKGAAHGRKKAPKARKHGHHSIGS